MKKSRKGLTLVEVIVSIAVFTIISLALFSTYLAMRKVVFLQEEYVRLEMVCHDINAYWDMYGDDGNGDGNEDEWYVKYFKDNIPPKSEASIVYYYGYLDANFNPTTANANSPYEIKFHYNGDDADKELIIDYIKTDDRTYVEALNCGKQGGKHEE